MGWACEPLRDRGRTFLDECSLHANAGQSARIWLLGNYEFHNKGSLCGTLYMSLPGYHMAAAARITPVITSSVFNALMVVENPGNSIDTLALCFA